MQLFFSSFLPINFLTAAPQHRSTAAHFYDFKNFLFTNPASTIIAMPRKKSITGSGITVFNCCPVDDIPGIKLR